MHTKKTNNTNKLIQISYHSILTKIQKLQNLKKKKKLFSVPAGTPGTGRYCPKLAGTRPVRPVFFPVRIRGVERTGLLAGTVYSGRTGRYGTELTTLQNIRLAILFIYLKFLSIWKIKVNSVFKASNL